MQALNEVGKVPSTMPVCMIMTSVMAYHVSFVGSGAPGLLEMEVVLNGGREGLWTRPGSERKLTAESYNSTLQEPTELPL